MQEYRTSNPMLRAGFGSLEGVGSGTMTLNGVLLKTALLFGIALVAGVLAAGDLAVHPGATWLILAGVIGGFCLAALTTVWLQASPVTAPLYALCEGVALGGISAAYEAAYHGIVGEALASTLAVVLVMMLLYAARILRPTRTFRTVVGVATGGIALYYLADMVVGLFHPAGLPFIMSSSPLGILFSVVVVIVAALNLVTDFGIIDDEIRSGAPSFMEWYGAFVLLVTVVWLYLELLRLLSKLRER